MSDTDTKEMVDAEKIEETVHESTEKATETKSDGIKLSDGLVGLVVAYLGNRPFSEVAGIIMTMDAEIVSQGKRITINHPKEEKKEEKKEEAKSEVKEEEK